MFSTSEVDDIIAGGVNVYLIRSKTNKQNQSTSRSPICNVASISDTAPQEFPSQGFHVQGVIPLLRANMKEAGTRHTRIYACIVYGYMHANVMAMQAIRSYTYSCSCIYVAYSAAPLAHSWRCSATSRAHGLWHHINTRQSRQGCTTTSP